MNSWVFITRQSKSPQEALEGAGVINWTKAWRAWLGRWRRGGAAERNNPHSSGECGQVERNPCVCQEPVFVPLCVPPRLPLPHSNVRRSPASAAQREAVAAGTCEVRRKSGIRAADQWGNRSEEKCQASVPTN